MTMHREWMYLEPIFSSEDINRQLPVETRKFNTMERNWRRIMKNAHDNPYVCKAFNRFLIALYTCIPVISNRTLIF